MPRTIGARRLALATLLAALTLPAGAQEAGDELRATYGDWQVRCATGTDRCAIAQVGQGPQGNDVLEVRVRKLDGATGPNGETFPAAIQILTPLGVALKAGVRVQVDGNEQRAAAFEVCAQGGCIVREPMQSDFLNELKGGATATLTIVAAPRREIVVPISRSGFTRAFNEIQA
ncbi:MAG: invasion associated locus B family protein [Paracoccaceae bacterium]